MEHVLDAFGVVSSLSIPVLTFLAMIGIVLLFSKIRSFNNELQLLVKTVNAMGRATIDEKGNPVVDVDILNDLKLQLLELKKECETYTKKANDHYVAVDHIASSEHWKNCDISKCIHLQSLFNKFDRIIERLDNFDKRADESRSSTITGLQSMHQAQKDLGVELGNLAKTIITVLSDILRDRKS